MGAVSCGLATRPTRRDHWRQRARGVRAGDRAAVVQAARQCPDAAGASRRRGACSERRLRFRVGRARRARTTVLAQQRLHRFYPRYGDRFRRRATHRTRSDAAARNLRGCARARAWRARQRVHEQRRAYRVSFIRAFAGRYADPREGTGRVGLADASSDQRAVAIPVRSGAQPSGARARRRHHESAGPAVYRRSDRQRAGAGGSDIGACRRCRGGDRLSVPRHPRSDSRGCLCQDARPSRRSASARDQA